MDEVSELTRSVDDLTEVDLDGLDDHELHEAVITLARQRDRLAVAYARLLARWDSRMVWQDDGSRSAAARLARETTSFIGTTRTELRRARHLAALVITSEAGSAGILSLDQVDVLTRADQPWRHRHLLSDETQLVEWCSELTAAASARLVTYWGHRVDAEVGRDDEARDQANRLHVSETLDGAVVVNGVLDALSGAAFANELRHLADEVRLSDLRTGIDRTPAQRRAAALVEMAIRSASAPADGRRPQPLFTVQLGDDSFQRLCELGHGTVISPSALVPWLSTADLETVLFDGPSTVVSVSHRRNFTGALRRAIEVRDRHCQHPSGCEIPADRCDVDHVVPFAQGGPTDQFNGRLQCPTHNRRTDLHDHGAPPLPWRSVGRIDALRARVRWRIRQAEPAGP